VSVHGWAGVPSGVPEDRSFLSAEAVRAIRFRYARPGSAGLAEADVYAFVARIADELAARRTAEAALLAENSRLAGALRRACAEPEGTSTGRHTRAADQQGRQAGDGLLGRHGWS
jgi:hypothetical protein